MTQKLSPHKISKMMFLYFQGWSQTEIASKLKIDQSTVSLHVGKLKSLAAEKDTKTAVEEYGITDTVEALHSLGAELKKNGLTVEEAQVGLKMELLFQKLGIKQEQYGQLINACKRMKEEGFIVAAVKLAYLEESNGMTYEQLLAHYGAAQKDLAEATGELQTATDKLAVVKKEVTVLEEQKTTAGEQLQSYMEQVGVDTQRIKLVEQLAKTLKDAGISNIDIEAFIQRQQALNKAGFDPGLFTVILDKAKLVTSLDHGKGLLKALSEYGSMTEVCAGLKAEAKALKGQVAGLEQQASLKGKIEVEVNKLKAEKANLEPLVADLHSKYQTRVMLQNDLAALEPEKAALEQKIGELDKRVVELEKDIKIKEKKVADFKADLEEYEPKRADLLKEVAELQARFERDKKRWEIFQGFLGLVQSTSSDELKKAAQTIPAIVEELPENTAEKDIDFLKYYVLQDLTGKKLPFLLKCKTCGASIITDMPEPAGGYQCTNGGTFPTSPHKVIIEKNPLAILKTALSPGKPKHGVTVQPITITSVVDPKTSDGNK